MSVTCGGTVVQVDAVVEIVREAGHAIMEIYTQDTEQWDVKVKNDDSPLTRADLTANSIICDKLSKLYPEIPIVSEENKAIPYETRRSWQYCFVVDPLDGTKEFIRRNGQFTVNVGLCAGGEPVLGVVAVPAVEPFTIYYGVIGDDEVTAFKEDEAERYPEPIQAAPFDESDDNLIIVASASHNTPATDEFISKYKSPQKISMGSSLKLLLVAEGRAHIYPRLAPTSEWDTCAAHAIVRAAGGRVVQHEGGNPCDHGKPVVYNKEDPLNPFFVVYGRQRGQDGAGGSNESKTAETGSSRPKKTSSGGACGNKSNSDANGGMGSFVTFLLPLLLAAAAVLYSLHSRGQLDLSQFGIPK